MIRCKTAGSEVGNRTVISSELVHCRWADEDDFDAALAGSGVNAVAAWVVTDDAVLNSDDPPEAAGAGVALAVGATGARKIPEFEGEAGRADDDTVEAVGRTGCGGAADCPAGPGTRVAGAGPAGERYVPVAEVEGLTGAR